MTYQSQTMQYGLAGVREKLKKMLMQTTEKQQTLFHHMYNHTSDFTRTDFDKWSDETIALITDSQLDWACCQVENTLKGTDYYSL